MDQIARSYPSVSREAVRAALCYAAALANERFVSLQQQETGVRFKLDENLPIDLADMLATMP